MKERLILSWLLVAGLGGVWALGIAPSAPTQVAPVTIAAAAEKKTAPPEDIDAAQRAIARQHIPGLVIFVAGAISLAVLLRLRARDLEKLRKQGFFGDRN